MIKVRVYEVARELGLDNRELVSKIASLGIQVRNHMSALEPAEVDRIKRALDKDRQSNVVEERIRPTVVRRRAVATPGRSAEHERDDITGAASYEPPPLDSGRPDSVRSDGRDNGRDNVRENLRETVREPVRPAPVAPVARQDEPVAAYARGDDVARDRPAAPAVQERPVPTPQRPVAPVAVEQAAPAATPPVSAPPQVAREVTPERQPEPVAAAPAPVRPEPRPEPVEPPRAVVAPVEAAPPARVESTVPAAQPREVERPAAYERQVPQPSQFERHQPAASQQSFTAGQQPFTPGAARAPYSRDGRPPAIVDVRRPNTMAPASERLGHTHLPPGVVARGNTVAPSAPRLSSEAVSRIVAQHNPVGPGPGGLGGGGAAIPPRRRELGRAALGTPGRQQARPGQVG
ncbi:MAG: hypothetical protein RLZZ450_3041, partial [Pseudomonadota bacterium]